MKVLTLSDVKEDIVYSPQIAKRFDEVDFVVSCGDLPYYYLEYVISSLNRPMFFIRGNHSSVLEFSSQGTQNQPFGAEDLHRKVVIYKDIILAGIEGSLRYRQGPFQYSQAEMWMHVLALAPKLVFNRAVYGRYLDIFITHAPPWGIHDQADLPHQGIKAFRWFLKTFKPRYHFHGHIHVYRRDMVTSSQFCETQVINSFGYVETPISPGERKFAPLGYLLRRART